MKNLLKSLQTGDIQSFLEGYRKAVTEKVLREKNECKPQALRELNEGKNNAMYFHNFDKPKYRQVAPKYKIFSKELLKQYIKACVTEADLMFSNLIQKEVGKDNYKKTLEDIQKQLESYVEKTHDYQLWHYDYKNSNISKPLLEDIVRAMHVRAKIFMYDIFKVQKLPQNIVKEIRWAIGKLFDNDDYLQLREVDPLVADLYHLAKFYPSILNNTQEMEKFIKTLKLESTLSVLMDEKKNSEQVAEVLLNGLRKLYKLPLTESIIELDEAKRILRAIGFLQDDSLTDKKSHKAILTDAELTRYAKAVVKAKYEEILKTHPTFKDPKALKIMNDEFIPNFYNFIVTEYKKAKDFSFWKKLKVSEFVTPKTVVYNILTSIDTSYLFEYSYMLERTLNFIITLKNYKVTRSTYREVLMETESDKLYKKYYEPLDFPKNSKYFVDEGWHNVMVSDLVATAILFPSTMKSKKNMLDAYRDETFYYRFMDALEDSLHGSPENKEAYIDELYKAIKDYLKL